MFRWANHVRIVSMYKLRADVWKPKQCYFDIFRTHPMNNLCDCHIYCKYAPESIKNQYGDIPNLKYIFNK